MRKNSPFHFIRLFLATGFLTGYFPVMPGTIGTLAGALIYVLLSPFQPFYLAALIPFIILSVVVSDYAEKKVFRMKDPSKVVIDEIAGFLVTMIGFSFTNDGNGWFYLVAGFALFRVLDIWKPYPIRKVQELKGGLGIVMDDILAGLFANIVLQLIRSTGLVHF